MATCTVCEIHAESTFQVEGMDCRDEVALIERRFKQLVGLEDFSADVMGRRLHVKYDAARLSTAAISEAVAEAGLRARLEDDVPGEPVAVAATRRPAALALSAAALGAGLLAEVAHVDGRAAIALYAVSLIGSVPLTWPKARQALRLGVLDINILMLVAAAGAMALGQWSEAAAVAFLFAVAQALEVRTLDRARRAVKALLDLAPPTVSVRQDGEMRLVAVSQVRPGAVMAIKPGETIALDGQVLFGLSAVNQAPVTGESMPVDKGPGDEVFAGSLNGNGALDVRVTRHHRETRLARIVHLVERAQSSRAPSQTLVDRFARVYTPAVLALAVAVALLPPLLTDAGWRPWFLRALVLLVVSCPCALVISTPVSIVAALAAAARRGVLVKGGVHLERAAQIRAVAFDKTGTTTVGRPEVAAVHPLAGVSAAEVVTQAAAVERRSEHPIAGAILRRATLDSVPLVEASGVLAMPGRGASGDVDGRQVLVGNHRLFEDRALCTAALHERLDHLASQGQTPVLVARGQTALGVIAVADQPRATARAAIDALRAQGVSAVSLLTGDSLATARSMAAALGIVDVHAELLPEDKAAAIQSLRALHGPIAMVGDGINDAPALASADLGIAFGGSDAAIETADVAVLTGDLTRIPWLLALGRATVRNIRSNLAMALALKLLFVVAAVAGLATLWMAVLADTGASVLVIANALRLLRVDDRQAS